MDSSRRPKRNQGNWNAWVLMGSDQADRKKRLAQVPKKWRSQVENHVRTAFAIRKGK